MILKDNVTEKQLSDYLNEYFTTYEEYLPSMFRSMYRLNYLSGLRNNPVIDSQICQFYKEYDLLRKESDMYQAFKNVIKHNHGDLSNTTILDVGGGLVPQLGRELAKEAKHVMVVDKNIVDKNNPNNLEVIKREIKSYKDLPSADIIVGLLPCEITRDIIDHACNYNEDFVIALCGCINDIILSGRLKINNMTKDDIANESVYQSIVYALEGVQEHQELGDVIEYASPYQFPYPVIGNKRR